MGEITLNWQNAQVKDGTLHVPLDGKPEKDWKAAFERTAQLLKHGTWETVEVKKGEARVAPLAEGDEERVRHFLESVVLEANSAIAPEDEEEERDGDDREDAHEHGDDAEASPDARMTDRFRGFGDGDEPDDADRTDADGSAQTA